MRHLPCGTLAISRCPRGARPFLRVIGACEDFRVWAGGLRRSLQEMNGQVRRGRFCFDALCRQRALALAPTILSPWAPDLTLA